MTIKTKVYVIKYYSAIYFHFTFLFYKLILIFLIKVLHTCLIVSKRLCFLVSNKGLIKFIIIIIFENATHNLLLEIKIPFP